MGKPNQDSVQVRQLDDVGSSIILSIADGHGSEKYSLSDIGADLAVKCACDVGTAFLESARLEEVLDQYSPNRIKQSLCRSIVACWRKEVTSHFQRSQCISEERSSGEQSTSPLPIGGESHYQKYGTTLISVIVTRRFILVMQLGDGDVLGLFPDGHVHRLIEKDPRFIANETTSLCLPEAWDEFAVTMIPYSNDLSYPVLILASTDGYANSFKNPSDFERVPLDILEYIESHWTDDAINFEKFEEDLKGWLNTTSKKGSGDDITVGIIGDPYQQHTFIRNRTIDSFIQQCIRNSGKQHTNLHTSSEPDIR